MQIKILETAKMRDAITAWTLSRDLDVAYSAEEIAKVDAPVLEMPSFLLNFENFTIFEREIFCSLRNHVVWARTSRVDDPRQFTVPDIFKVSQHGYYRASMESAALNGVKQDQWRLLLPLVAHANWTQRISIRDFARLTLYFDYLRGKAQYHPLSLRFGQITYELTKVLAETCGGKIAHSILTNIKLAKFMHEEPLLPPIVTDGVDVGTKYFQLIAMRVNIALRAQVIRHRELQFIDNFWSLINSEELPYLQLKSEINMQLIARRDIWHAVMSKRACWIAQSDLWEPLIRASGLHPPLPCDNGKCPYEVDARTRLTPGKDPNPPCPVFCNIYGISKDPWRNAMMDEAQMRGQFWVEEVNK